MKELRTIIFDETEAAAAVVMFCRRNKRSLPSGTLKGFAIREGDGVTGVLSITDDYGFVHEMLLTQEEVAAALVAHCMTRSIPLPKEASKVITAVDNQVVMAFEIGHVDAKKMVRASRMRG